MRRDVTRTRGPSRPAQESGSLPRGRGGFTLIEAVIALTIVLLVGGLAWPSLRALGRGVRFREGQRVVAAAIADARAQATATGRPVRLVLTTSGPQAGALFAETMPEAEGVAVVRSLTQLPDGLTMAGPAVATDGAEAAEREGGATDRLAVAVLLPEGGGEGGTVVELRDEGGQASRLAINPWTGSVRWESSAVDVFAGAEADGEPVATELAGVDEGVVDTAGGP